MTCLIPVIQYVNYSLLNFKVCTQNATHAHGKMQNGLLSVSLINTHPLGRWNPLSALRGAQRRLVRAGQGSALSLTHFMGVYGGDGLDPHQATGHPLGAWRSEGLEETLPPPCTHSS